MAISPPSDLVLDVVKAADPERLKVAAAKLQTIARDAGVDGGMFANAFDQFSDTAAPTHVGNSVASQRVAMHNRTAVAFSAFTPTQKFEALMLQQFVEAMMPDDAEDVYGKGTAGSIWKSMLAEQIGRQVVSAGGIGIADMIDRSLHTTPKT